jgi:acyl carrier protein
MLPRGGRERGQRRNEGSMTDQDIRQLVLDIIEVVAPDSDISNLKDDVRLRDQLELDSMDFLDIVMELRKRHKVEVPKEDYAELATLASCVAYLRPRLETVSAGR